MVSKIIKKEWVVYLLECSDGTIYTGITNDLEARIGRHNLGKGAKYTRSRTPVILKGFKVFNTKSEALRVEYAIKQLTRIKKLELIKKGINTNLLKNKVNVK